MFFSCLFSPPDDLKEDSQWSHLWMLSLLSLWYPIMCWFRSFFELKVVSHFEHWKGFSQFPAICVCKAFGYLKYLRQTPYWSFAISLLVPSFKGTALFAGFLCNDGFAGSWVFFTRRNVYLTPKKPRPVSSSFNHSCCILMVLYH